MVRQESNDKRGCINRVEMGHWCERGDKTVACYSWWLALVLGMMCEIG